VDAIGGEIEYLVGLANVQVVHFDFEALNFLRSFGCWLLGNVGGHVRITVLVCQLLRKVVEDSFHLFVVGNICDLGRVRI